MQVTEQRKRTHPPWQRQLDAHAVLPITSRGHCVMQSAAQRDGWLASRSATTSSRTAYGCFQCTHENKGEPWMYAGSTLPLSILPVIHFQSTAVQLSFPSDKLYKGYHDLSALTNVKDLSSGVCECNAILYIGVKIVFFLMDFCIFINGFMKMYAI